MPDPNVVISAVIPLDDEKAVEIRFAGRVERLAEYVAGWVDQRHHDEYIARAIGAWTGQNLDHVDIKRVHAARQPCGCPDGSACALAPMPSLGDAIAQREFLAEVLNR